MKTHLSMVLVVALLLSGLTIASAAGYPSKNIQGIIQWGAGGATDSVSRAATPHVEPALGREVVLVNKTGGSGAVGAQYVLSRPADGYTLLYGAENPLLYQVLGLADFDYHTDFTPINVLAGGVTVIVAQAESPWGSLKDLVEDAQQRPGVIRMGAAGPGGAPHVVSAMIQSVVDFPVAPIVFDGEGPAVVAMMGGHVDFVPANLTAVAEYLKAGRVKVLGVVAKDPVNGLDQYPLVVDSYPGLAKYLPWGSFFGVWVDKDVPDAIKKKLADSFKVGVESGQFRQFVKDFGAIPLNLSGDEAEKFTRHWQSVTTWLMHDVGATKKSPAEFGIPRP